MKANELMIGDWVGIEYYATGVAIDGNIKAEKKLMQCKVFRIEEHIVTLGRPDGMIQDCLVSDIIPIPLTSDILLQNGFEFEQGALEGVYVFEDEDIDTRIVVHPKETNYTKGGYTYIHVDHGCVSVEELPIMNVHELQNSLRSFYIEKEIEL